MAIDFKKVKEDTIYWSRTPGKLVNLYTGEEQKNGIVFEGTIREWYDTLMMVLQGGIDIFLEKNGLSVRDSHLLSLRASSDIFTILEHTVYYRPDVSREYQYSSPRLGYLNGIEIREDRLLNKTHEIIISYEEIREVLKIKVLDICVLEDCINEEGNYIFPVKKGILLD